MPKIHIHKRASSFFLWLPGKNITCSTHSRLITSWNASYSKASHGINYHILGFIILISQQLRMAFNLPWETFPANLANIQVVASVVLKRATTRLSHCLVQVYNSPFLLHSKVGRSRAVVIFCSSRMSSLRRILSHATVSSKRRGFFVLVNCDPLQHEKSFWFLRHCPLTVRTQDSNECL